MTTNSRGKPNGVAEADPTEPDGVDPRDTEHPTGAKQAAENTANDPPG